MAYDEELADRVRAVVGDEPMRGWLTVDPSACAKAADLKRWVNRGVTFARSLPSK